MKRLLLGLVALASAGIASGQSRGDVSLSIQISPESAAIIQQARCEQLGICAQKDGLRVEFAKSLYPVMDDLLTGTEGLPLEQRREIIAAYPAPIADYNSRTGRIVYAEPTIPATTFIAAYQNRPESSDLFMCVPDVGYCAWLSETQ